MVAQYTHGPFGSIGPSIPSVPSNKSNTIVAPRSIYVIGHARVQPSFRIERDLLIGSPYLTNVAKVLHPFYVKVQQIQGEFIVTSDVSDVYESGDAPEQAVLNCLYSLVDELLWFQGHKESLSYSMFKDFKRLQFYLGWV
jgi:hypothetical protein